jgi:3-deoxy-D-manno-octulosonic-acid transferase
MLSRLYQYVTICFIGGGFTKDGIHNVLEAAVYHKPILFGPTYHKFNEAIELIKESGAYSVNNLEAFEERMNVLLHDSNAYSTASNASGNYVADNAGATNKIMNAIYEKRLLTN